MNELVYNEDKSAIKGVITQDMGVDRNGAPKDSFEPGMEFLQD